MTDPNTQADQAKRDADTARMFRAFGIVAIVAFVFLAGLGVWLVTQYEAAPVFVAVGVTIIALAGLGAALGVVLVGRSGPAVALRNAATVVAVLGIAATFVVGLTTDYSDTPWMSDAIIVFLLLFAFAIIVCWALTFVLALAIRKATGVATR